MSYVTRLAPGDPFPPTSNALAEPNGLLAVGGDLSVRTLLSAYRRGIFPWFEAPQPILWWTPDPRSVLTPDSFRVSRSLRRSLRRREFRLSVDRVFSDVIRRCAAARPGQNGTWIGAEMISAYTRLHRHGHAHSFEVWDSQGILVGGLYGVAIGSAFFGESMFSQVDDASKVALTALMQHMAHTGGTLVDYQMETTHLNSLGALSISRKEFEQRLAMAVDNPAPTRWQLPEQASALLPAAH